MATEIPTGNATRDIQDTIEGARNGLRAAIDKGSERASHFKDAAMEKAGHYREVAMERGRTALSSIERTIDERPLAVLGGVFVGGLILGLLLRRD